MVRTVRTRWLERGSVARRTEDVRRGAALRAGHRGAGRRSRSIWPTTIPGRTIPSTARAATRSRPRALAWKPGDPIPHVEYTEGEHEIWRTVSRELAPKHERLACRAFREAKAALALPEDHVPQLDEVTAALAPLTGFQFHPAAGLVPLDEFYGSLADRVFHSTQYLRHPSSPLYTPEPDIVHEVIGHGNLLADPQIAEVKRLAGEAARRCETAEEPPVRRRRLLVHDRVRRDVRGGRAALLRRGAAVLVRRDRGVPRRRHRPIDFHAMATLEYDITHYQPILFACDGMGELTERVGGFFAEFDDDTPERLARAGGAAGVAS